MTWLWYLLEANLYLLVFYAFYLAFLQNETFYTLNRFYLIITSVVSFILPVLQLGILRVSTEMLVDEEIIENGNNIIYQPLEHAPSSSSYVLSDYLLILYIVIIIVLSIKLAVDVRKILRLRLNAKKEKLGAVVVIELPERGAFSFFNLLFVHPELSGKEVVMAHEMVHIKQKHSLDILFFEILQIISWFNPIIYIIKNEVKLVHEYIADELSAPDAHQKHEYAMFLIHHSLGIMPIPLANQFFNQSILKRRINMLNKKRTVGWARLRLLFALPLTGGMLCASTMAFTKEYGYVDLLPEKSENTATIFAQHMPTKKEKMDQEPVKSKANPPEKKVKVRQVKFPPPVVRSQHYYYPSYRKNSKTGTVKSVEGRQIVINGKPIKDQKSFFGAKNAERVIYLAPTKAVEKYGNNAKFGAIEISGNDIELLKEPVVIPPPAANGGGPRRPKVNPSAKTGDEKLTQVRIRPSKKQEVVDLVVVTSGAQEQKMQELNIIPTKRALDSVQILHIKPTVPKKVEKLQEIKIIPTKRGEKMPETSLNKDQSQARQLTAKAEKAVKESIQLEIVKARDKAQLKTKGL